MLRNALGKSSIKRWKGIPEKDGTFTASARRTKAHEQTKVCTSLSARTCPELVEKAREAFAQGTDLVEFRIDLLRPPIYEEIEMRLSEFSGRCILTVRPVSEGGGFEGDESERVAFIRRLAKLSPAFFDVELLTLEANPALAHQTLGRKVIVSWHDFVRTPGRAALLSTMARAASYGGVVKIVVTANNATDNLTILSLYDESGPPPIAFCMGSLGLISRVMAMEKGSPIAYASQKGESTALGQPPLNYLLAIRRRLEDA